MLKLPSVTKPNEQADWAELCCLFSDQLSLSRSELRIMFESDVADEEKNDLEDCEAVDTIIDDIWTEIIWRNSVGGHFYPFTISPENTLTKKADWNQYLPYVYMLLLSRHYFFASTKINTALEQYSKPFERLTTHATRKYLGLSICIGSPRRYGVPTNFIEALGVTSDLCNEALCSEPNILKWAKDEDVDVIAWRPIDNRSGQVFILLQCTIERNWHSKPKVDIDTWWKIIDFSAKPMPGLAIPFVEHEEWHKRSIRKGVIFDRLRLSRLFQNSKYLHKYMKSFCETQIPKLPTA